MADNDSNQRKKLPVFGTVVFIVVILVVILVVWLAIGRSDDNTSVPTIDTTVNQSQTPNSPDKVKDTSGGNSDTTPSSSGTGAGSDNSLLGQ